MRYLLIVLTVLFMTTGLSAQSWELVKEDNGIRVFTRSEPGSSLKSFRGEKIIQASFDKICAVLDNPYDTSWWGDGISDIRVLAYEPLKFARYYMVYQLPWPMSDRDLVVETAVSQDAVTGERRFITRSLADQLPEKSGRVRMKDYRQSWTVQPMKEGKVRVVLEGSFNPGGNIPSSAYNLVVERTPVKSIRSLEEAVRNK